MHDIIGYIRAIITPMEDKKIFLSVGGTSNDKQESFVRAVEDRLRIETLTPNTIGRTKFSSDAPLKAILDCMDECSGSIIIAFERTFFPAGSEKRNGPKETQLTNTMFPTPWNQIEAGIAYSKGLPLLVIIEEGIRTDGLLEKGNDWYVMTVELDIAALNTSEFNGVLASWKKKVESFHAKPTTKSIPNASELTIGDLIKSLKVSQLWGLLAALVALAAGAFALGKMFHG
jgi:hypothetical protein